MFTQKKMQQNTGCSEHKIYSSPEDFHQRCWWYLEGPPSLESFQTNVVIDINPKSLRKYVGNITPPPHR